jgi:hypothetical protein
VQALGEEIRDRYEAVKTTFTQDLTPSTPEEAALTKGEIPSTTEDVLRARQDPAIRSDGWMELARQGMTVCLGTRLQLKDQGTVWDYGCWQIRWMLAD